jgi:uncharacterized protein YggL (DUF469 family)
MPKNRSKRLRKKLRVGEFQELVFWISFMLSEIDQEALNDFIDRFITRAIKNNNLRFAGGIGESAEGFVRLDKRGSITEEHKTLVKSWLDMDPLVTDIKIGELIDVKEGVLALLQVIADEERQSSLGFLILPPIVGMEKCYVHEQGKSQGHSL